MSDRMRLVGWQVQPVVMADDGEHLTAVNVAPQMIPAAQWPAFKNGLDAQALESVRQQIEGASPAAQALAIAERAVQAATQAAEATTEALTERDEALALAGEIGELAKTATHNPFLAQALLS